MVAELGQRQRQREPFNLVITGEAETWKPALEQIVGLKYLRLQPVRNDRELLKVVETGCTDAAVLDDANDWPVSALHLLRMIRRINHLLPVVVISSRRDRRWLEDALRLTAFSVVVRPLALEELLRQIERMMRRIDEALRGPRPQD